VLFAKRKDRYNQFTVTLNFKDNQLYLEKSYPVELISDETFIGFRVLTLHSPNSRKTHHFRVNALDKHKNIKKHKVKGIILKRF
jgi:hypothetical protein